MSSILRPISYPDDLPVKVELMEIDKYPLHVHNDIQIVYVLEGELALKMTFAHYTLKRNSIHLIHNDDVHSITSISEHNLVLSLYINVDYFSNYFPGLDNTIFTTKISETSPSYKELLALRDQIFAIVNEQYNKSPGYTNRVIDCTLSLITMLEKNFRGFTIENEYRILEYKSPNDLFQVDRISRIIQYMYNNYPYRLTLAEIAEKEKISPYYLSHLFQKYTSCSFRSFLSFVRAEMSEVKLLTTSDSMSRIAQDVGFSDVKYYVESFINWFGRHPKEYRNLYFDKTIDKVSPIYKTFPLSKLKESIGDHTNQQIFSDPENDSLKTNLVFDAPPIDTMKQISPLSQMLNNVSLQQPGGTIPNAYFETNPQLQCVDIVGKLAAEHSLGNDIVTIIDTPELVNGLFAVNGLKKPAFYLLSILEKIPRAIIASGETYLFSGDGARHCLITFNPNEHGQTFPVFDITGFKHNTKLTNIHMSAQSTYAAYWAQLNFKRELSQSEFSNIERMSMPEVSYKIIPAQNRYKLSCTLDPLDIKIFMFDRI